MKLSIGIVGLPNVGKSTLFKLLTKQEVNIANYPFATIDPNIGVVVVPDERLKKLAELNASKKIVPAVIEFYDIAGLVKGANKGEGLGNQFLSHIKEVNAIVEVVRCFPEGEIIHVEERIDPVRDMEIINTELVLKDLDTVEKRLIKLEQETKTDKKKIKDVECVKRVQGVLTQNKLARQANAEDIKELVIQEMNLLTAKPQMYLLNGNESDVSEALKTAIQELGAEYIVMNLAEAKGLETLIQKAYEALGLISFLTTGEDETRAWTIRRGNKAPQAAGAIHSDFEKKFIRAEVIEWNKLIEIGSWSAAKQKGWLRLEGKEYVVQDGDVMEIRHHA